MRNYLIMLVLIVVLTPSVFNIELISLVFSQLGAGDLFVYSVLGYLLARQNLSDIRAGFDWLDRKKSTEIN